MNKILIVDDEEKIRTMIAKYVAYEGYEALTAKDGYEAIDIFKKEDIDVVVLDVMMPSINGFDTLKKLKEIKDVHCIFLTAMGEEYDRIYGFDIGGEDYVTKPFTPKELMMRIKVILNRNSKISNKIIYKDLIIDEDAHNLIVNNEKIEVPNKEYELLLLLLKNKGKVVTREKIITTIWGYEYDGDDRTLDTHMKMLRKDLKEYGDCIKTLRGVGYRFEEEA